MCGVSRLSPARAIKNVFVGAAAASWSGAPPCAKLVTAQPKQSNAAYFTVRKNNFKFTDTPEVHQYTAQYIIRSISWKWGNPDEENKSR